MIHIRRQITVRLVSIVLCSLALSACEKQRTVGAESVASGSSARSAAAVQSKLAPEAPRRNESLAYEHTVSIELSKEALPARMREVEAACQSSKEFSCTLLDFSVSTNAGVPGGSIRMRLAPTGVEPIIAIAGKGGDIASRTTHAEDLAEPIADTERELALLTTHRDRLAEFMKNKDIKVEQLITVSRELSTAQSQIDSLNTRRANLRRRVDTELLTLNLSLPRVDQNAQQSPVLDAFASFGSDFKSAIANVIGFVAILLPWLVVLVPGIILLRMFWYGIGRWLTRRAA